MIQTDAAINPGNSGRTAGQRAGGGRGRELLDFLQQRRVHRPRFRHSDRARHRGYRRDHRTGGATGLDRPRGRRARRHAELERRAGLPSRAWRPGGPAEQAGLKPGDVLVQANGRRLRNFLDWEAVKLDLDVGDPVGSSVRAARRTWAPPGDRRSSDRHRREGDGPPGSAAHQRHSGVQAERGMRSEQGALIFRISPQVSQATGLQEGDVILAINRTPVRERRRRSASCSEPAGRPPTLFRAGRADQLHRPGVPMSDDRYRSPLGTRYASPAMQIALGRAAPDRALAPALARAGREPSASWASPSPSRRWPRCAPTSTTSTSPPRPATSGASATT